MNYTTRQILEDLQKAIGEKDPSLLYKIESSIRSLYDETQREARNAEIAKKELEFVRQLQQERINTREFFLWFSGVCLLGMTITICYMVFHK